MRVEVRGGTCGRRADGQGDSLLDHCASLGIDGETSDHVFQGSQDDEKRAGVQHFVRIVPLFLGDNLLEVEDVEAGTARLVSGKSLHEGLPIRLEPGKPLKLIVQPE